VGALLVARVSFAELPRAKDFYEHDYAIAPGVAGEGGGASARPKSKTKSDSTSANDASTVVELRGNRLSTRGKKRRLLIDVTANSADPKHFVAVIEAVTRLHDAKLAFIGTVTHVGDYRSVTPEIETELARRGILLMEGFSPPSGTPPPLSPLWEIRAPEGQHIAEGYLSIEPFINEYGEYDPKHRGGDPQKPEVAVEGF
jgi:hypothetical protein